MKYLSVCSGIEAATVAWHHMGWTPVGFSEIEKFPSAVLAHHYPSVPNWGDMTTLPERILSREIEAPDVLVGGTPCQAFSVAGLRQGLADARGSLSLTYCEIADAIDHVRLADGRNPAIIVYENVPGLLSSKDNAFGCLLAGLAGESEALQAPRGKWRDAGVVVGPQRLAVWRVLDAQFFGVAQRRRRVFLVSVALRHPRAWAIAESLLPFQPCLPGNPPPSREARQAVARGAAAGAGERSHWDGDYPHPTLNQSAKSSGGVGSSNQELFSQRGAYLAPHPAGAYVGNAEGGALDAPFLTCSNIASHVNNQTPLVAQPLMFKVRGGSETDTGARGSTDQAFTLAGAPDQWLAQPVAFRDPCPTLTARMQGSSGWAPTNEDAHLVGVTQPIAFHPTQEPITSEDGSTHCIGTGSKQGAATVAVAYGTDCYNGAITGDVAATLGTPGSSVGASGPTVMQPVAFAQNQLGEVRVGEVLNTLNTNSNASGRNTPMVAQPSVRDVSQTITSNYGKQVDSSDTALGPNVVFPTMQVRRLTPVECERLQGFPDNYTNIPWRKQPEAPDGPRYKALGNSMAVPVMRWIGERINEVEKQA